MHINQLLSDLAARLGLPSLTLDNEGNCAVVFDGNLQVELHYADAQDMLCLGADLGVAQAGRRAELARRLLLANVEPGEQEDAFFATEQTHQQMMLCRTVDVQNQGADSLMNELSRLVTSCRQWREQLAQENLLQA